MAVSRAPQFEPGRDGPSTETISQRDSRPAGARVQPLSTSVGSRGDSIAKAKDKRDRLVGSTIAAFTALMFASGTVLLKSLLTGTQNPYVILSVRFGGVVVLLGIFI